MREVVDLVVGYENNELEQENKCKKPRTLLVVFDTLNLTA
jgi:hypothetical protein